MTAEDTQRVSSAVSSSLGPRRLHGAKNLAEQSANMWRLLCCRLRLLMQHAADLAGIRLRVLAAELSPREHAENNWRQHHEQLPHLLGIEPAGLLHALLDGIAVSAEDASDETTAAAAHIRRGSPLQHVREVVRQPVMGGARTPDPLS